MNISMALYLLIQLILVTPTEHSILDIYNSLAVPWTEIVIH